ncbi:galactose mutarotase [Arthrobacter sp. MN05-02]|nr:galactose mutarotase [Arthrobacter sp. MN05-02]
MRTISGQQYVLKVGDSEAHIASIGATLRGYSCHGVDLLMPFDAAEERPAMRGALLAPWPNRTANAEYRFRGSAYALPMNEPERGNASHGLVSDLDFTPISEGAQELTLTAMVGPQPGYPWSIRLDVRFVLREEGLTQSVTATNESMESAPFGMGGHPYLLAGNPGPTAVDGWTLELPANEVLLVDPVRYLPQKLVYVDEYERGCFDFRTPRKIGQTVLNNAFTGLARDGTGRATVRLFNGQRTGVELELSAECKWVQLYTTDVPGSPVHRHALAVEPMTCPPDALNSGRDLRVLAPGESVHVEWVLRRLGG